MPDKWNSVQIVTLVVSALTPITVLVLGFMFTRASRRIEQVQWANQTVVTHRLEIYDKLAPGLNQLLCFATFVGGWKEIDPLKAISTRRCSPTRCCSPTSFSPLTTSSWTACSPCTPPRMPMRSCGHR